MIRARLSLAIQTALFSDSLTIIPHLNTLVKRFFKSFFNFFAVFFTDPLVVSLHIIALLFLFVNSFFESFFDLEIQASLYKDRALFLCSLTNIPRFTIPTSAASQLFRAYTFLFKGHPYDSHRKFFKNRHNPLYNCAEVWYTVISQDHGTADALGEVVKNRILPFFCAPVCCPVLPRRACFLPVFLCPQAGRRYI